MHDKYKSIALSFYNYIVSAAFFAVAIGAGCKFFEFATDSITSDIDTALAYTIKYIVLYNGYINVGDSNVSNFIYNILVDNHTKANIDITHCYFELKEFTELPERDVYIYIILIYSFASGIIPNTIFYTPLVAILAVAVKYLNSKEEDNSPS